MLQKYSLVSDAFILFRKPIYALRIVVFTLFFFISYRSVHAQIGTTWTSRAAASANTWYSVTYGNGLFVAIAKGENPATVTNIMTSPDGITWTAYTAPVMYNYCDITYGNGLFVAVSSHGANQVITSTDGITWTGRTPATTSAWYAVTYGNGLFVATAISSLNAVMTSPNGITWTSRSSPVNDWRSVTYANGLFVAVGSSYEGNRVMTSPDGITWTGRYSPTQNEWLSVTYGNGLFVAVAGSGVGNRVMTSPDGITWTARSPAADYQWNSVTYGNGIFVAVSGSGVMTSLDGITWTSQTAAANDNWWGVTYGNGVFVGVSTNGTVMTSGTLGVLPIELINFTAHPLDKTIQLTWQTASEKNNDHFDIEYSTDGKTFSKMGQITGHGTTSQIQNYGYVDTTPFSGVNYYRLKQMDIDGKFTYSKTVSVKMGQSDKKINVYPNPVKDKVIIETNLMSDYTVDVFDITGRLLQSQNVNQAIIQLAINDLPNGVYLISVKSSAIQQMFKIVKQ
jgi:Secretion system C-terminal sorting domain